MGKTNVAPVSLPQGYNAAQDPQASMRASMMDKANGMNWLGALKGRWWLNNNPWTAPAPMNPAGQPPQYPIDREKPTFNPTSAYPARRVPINPYTTYN